MSENSNIERQFKHEKPIGSVSITFDQLKLLIDSAIVIALNSDQVVYRYDISRENLIELDWIDEDGDRYSNKVLRSDNEGLMYVEPDGKIVVFDSEGDIDRIHCYQVPMQISCVS